MINLLLRKELIPNLSTAATKLRRQFTMNQLNLSPDDLPTYQMIKLSGLWLSQLEEATKKSFFSSCDRLVRIVLSSCHWYFKVNGGILMLIMICHDLESYQNIMITVPHLANRLRRFANHARISLSSPINNGIAWIIEVEETLSEEE